MTRTCDAWIFKTKKRCQEPARWTAAPDEKDGPVSGLALFVQSLKWCNKHKYPDDIPLEDTEQAQQQ